MVDVDGRWSMVDGRWSIDLLEDLQLTKFNNRKFFLELKIADLKTIIDHRSTIIVFQATFST